MSKHQPRAFKHLERALDLRFRTKSLLLSALTHRSYLNEAPCSDNDENNQRLEYLGDAVLRLVVREFLFDEHPDLDEGDMTILESRLACNENLAEVARSLSLGDYVFKSRGMEITDKLLADVFEALLGAIYKDQGFGTVRLYIDHLLLRKVRGLIGRELKDPKTILQEMAQAQYGLVPEYEVVSTDGPDHLPYHDVIVKVGDAVLGRGRSNRKKQAEKAAALDALERHFNHQS